MPHDRGIWNILFKCFLKAINNECSLTYVEQILVYYSCKHMTLTFHFISGAFSSIILNVPLT